MKNLSLAKDKCCANPVTADDATLADFFNDQDELIESERLDGPSDKILKRDDDASESEDTKTVNCIQPPVIPCVYTDAVSKKEKCLVVLIFSSGVKGLSVDLVMKENVPEPTVVVKYKWPTEMYEVKKMFENDEDDTMLVEEGSPKFQAVEKALRQYRENIEDAPVATIEVKLPVEVKQDPESWKKTFNKKNIGSVVVFLEFECVRNEFGICKTEKFLNFD